MTEPDNWWIGVDPHTSGLYVVIWRFWDGKHHSKQPNIYNSSDERDLIWYRFTEPELIYWNAEGQAWWVGNHLLKLENKPYAWTMIIPVPELPYCPQSDYMEQIRKETAERNKIKEQIAKTEQALAELKKLL